MNKQPDKTNKQLEVTASSSKAMPEVTASSSKAMPEVTASSSKAMPEVTAYFSTRGRYDTGLPLALMSVIMQTKTPERIIIFDDNIPQTDLRSKPLYVHIFRMMDQKGIKWEVIFGEGKGQVLNHQKMLDMAKTELIWRVDDDNYVEPNVLQELYNLIISDNELGAVASVSLGPHHIPKYKEGKYSEKIEDLKTKMNVQWCTFKGRKYVDHLYNTFLYRKEAGKHGYCMELSPVGHCEETLFTYQMKRNGWKLMVTGDVITWHLKLPYGGIRSHTDANMYYHDEQVFDRIMKEYGVDITRNIIVLNNGMGDHIVFKKLLPEIKERYQNLIIACCYAEIFEDTDVPLMSIKEAEIILGDLSSYDIYKWMWDNNWKDELIEAYRARYLK